MSDFIICKKDIPYRAIDSAFTKIYNSNLKINHYYNNFFQIALTENIYNGFGVYESDNKICAVIGGPVLKFRDNSFLIKKNSNEGTKAIYERWKILRNISWPDDIDGPYVIILFDLIKNDIEIVTDMMSFIPVYQYIIENKIIIGTHINAIDAIGKFDIDKVSVADFLETNIITFPYTILKNVKQIFPASEHKWFVYEKKIMYEYLNYWLPYEENSDIKNDLNYLSNLLINGLEIYISNLFVDGARIAILLSGGEDSRLIATLKPRDVVISGFIFSENINKEIEIAKSVANLTNIDLSIINISKSYFLDNINGCSDLVGAGEDCFHVHAYGFQEKFKINKFDVVLGGFLADTYLKLLKAPKKHTKLNNIINRYLGKYDILRYEYNFNEIFSRIIKSKDILNDLNYRKKKHYENLKKIRPNSAMEWMGIWPMSMQEEIPNLHGHRRIIKNYEPFSASSVIKVAAIADQILKLNRKLFHHAAHKQFKEMKWIQHNKGFLPYFSNNTNLLIFSPFIRLRGLLFHKNSNLNTWINFKEIYKQHKVQWQYQSFEYVLKEYLSDVFDENIFENMLEQNYLNYAQKRNIIQLGYFLNNKYPDKCF